MPKILVASDGRFYIPKNEGPPDSKWAPVQRHLHEWKLTMDVFGVGALVCNGCTTVMKIEAFPSSCVHPWEPLTLTEDGDIWSLFCPLCHELVSKVGRNGKFTRATVQIQ